ncbi:hypothetical protein [Kitasatospora sp. NPDC059599]|uniref:hypothetical protein n=1 Tax=Kitasatospora sp. NPDC059599 TaxID=3346880 RepID=UPI0036A69E17
MDDDLDRKPAPADPCTNANTATDATPVPAEPLTLRQIGRTAVLSLAATPAPILLALVDWWLKTH